MRSNVIVISVLMFIYNGLFAYMIFQFTSGQIRLMLLAFLAMDYIFIFYLVFGIAKELLALESYKAKARKAAAEKGAQK